jgi:DNA-binding NarL/FixJ family response regulator
LDAGAKGYVVKSNAARDLLEAVDAVSQHRIFTALAASAHSAPYRAGQSEPISEAVSGRKDLP